MKATLFLLLCCLTYNISAQDFESYNEGKEYKMNIVGYYESTKYYIYHSAEDKDIDEPLLTYNMSSVTKGTPEVFMKELFLASSKEEYYKKFDFELDLPKYDKNIKHDSENHFALIHKLELKFNNVDFCIFKYKKIKKGKEVSSQLLCLKKGESGWKVTDEPFLKDLTFVVGNLSEKTFDQFLGREKIKDNSKIETIRLQSRSNDFVDIPKLSLALRQIQNSDLWIELIKENYKPDTQE